VIIINQTIKYIAFYDTHYNSNERRNYSLAATNKIDYICSVLNKAGFKVLIVSPSRTEKNQFFRGKRIELRKDVDLKLFPTLPWGNKLQKLFSLVFGDFLLLMYLLLNIQKNETIIVYHSLGLLNIVNIAKKIKKFEVVLEVEEIYQDVMSYSKYTMKNEYKTIAIADKYIFPTELLNEKLNVTNKPYSIIYGTYQVEEDRNFKFNDGKIHVVYAGTFDPRKGGALAAAAAAEYLSNRYHVHIIGFGSKEQIEYIKDIIKEVSKKTEATITYDGLLKGEEYIIFLQKCDIGLSTQIPGATFNVTSFPSKILSYMANGLRVVSVRIEAIEKSAVGNAVCYYEEQTPESIAEAINSIDLNEFYDSRELIRKLDMNFTESLRKLLEV